MRDGAAKSFDKLADFLVKEYAKDGKSIRDLIHMEMGAHNSLNPDEAYEEVIARLCESFLGDIHLSDKAAQLYRTDRETANAFVKFLRKIKEKLDAWLKGVSPQSAIGKIGAEMAKANDRVYDLFIEGIQRASDNMAYRSTTGESGARVNERQNAIELSSDEDIVQKNIASGNTAVKFLIEQAKTSDSPEQLVFENAMYRSDIGQIDFRWGTAGIGAKLKHGYGLAHIIAKRNAENNNGEDVAYKMVEVIAKATNGSLQSNNQVSPENARIKLYYDGYTAVLVKSNNGNKWLLTGWENEETAPNATGEVRDSSSATAVTPIRTRRNGDVAVSDNIILPQNENNSNTSEEKRLNQSRDSDYLSAVESGDMETAQRMVDEAAKAAGYTIKAYHGTLNYFYILTKGKLLKAQISMEHKHCDNTQKYKRSAKRRGISAAALR